MLRRLDPLQAAEDRHGQLAGHHGVPAPGSILRAVGFDQRGHLLPVRRKSRRLETRTVDGVRLDASVHGPTHRAPEERL